MSADWKGANGMTELTITAKAVKEAPKYKKTAAALLERCRAFYQDPENERAYQEWKARKEEQHEKTAV